MMRYNDPPERSAEYLRQAIALMSRQQAGLNPITYTVWYEYVSGMNATLKSELDRLTAEGTPLDDGAIHALFRRHIAELDEESARRVADGFQKVLTEVATSTAQANDEAHRFDASLAQWSEELAAEATDLNAPLDRIRTDTRAMRETMTTLKTQLEESQREVETLRKEVVRAREDALSDGLTGLANRKRFDQALTATIGAMAAGGPGPSLLITDIDHFKRINDAYGHLFGDRVLCAVANVLKANVKGRDLAARFGGEEFVVLLPDTPPEGALALAEKLRLLIAGSRIRRLDNNESVEAVTMSFGVGSYRPGETVADFLNRTDSALYASKAQGRNRVTLAA